MSENTANPTGSAAEVADAKREAAEAVVDRVESYQDGAEKGTVEKELKEGFAEAGVDVPAGEVDKMADEIHHDGHTDAPGKVD